MDLDDDYRPTSPKPELKDPVEEDSGDEEDFSLVSTIRYDPVLENSSDGKDWKSTQSSGDSRSPFLLLPFHRDRLAAAAEAFGWTEAIAVLSQDDALDRLARLCEIAVQKARPSRASPGDKSPYRIRTLLSKDGSFHMEVSQVAIRPFDLLGAPFMTPAYLVPLTPNTLMTWPTAYAPILAVYLDTAPTPIGPFTLHKTTVRKYSKAARKRSGIASLSAPEEVLLYNDEGEIIDGSLRNICIWRDGSWITPPLTSGCMDGAVRRWMLQSGKVREARVVTKDLEAGEWVLTSNGVEGCSFGKFVPDPESYRKAHAHSRVRVL